MAVRTGELGLNEKFNGAMRRLLKRSGGSSTWQRPRPFLGSAKGRDDQESHWVDVSRETNFVIGQRIAPGERPGVDVGREVKRMVGSWFGPR